MLFVTDTHKFPSLWSGTRHVSSHHYKDSMQCFHTITKVGKYMGPPIYDTLMKTHGSSYSRRLGDAWAFITRISWEHIWIFFVMNGIKTHVTSKEACVWHPSFPPVWLLGSTCVSLIYESWGDTAILRKMEFGRHIGPQHPFSSSRKIERHMGHDDQMKIDCWDITYYITLFLSCFFSV